MLQQARPTLALRALSKWYGSVAAIDNVSLDIASGEFVSLLGPSGSGKTSILMAIAGFVQPDHGQIMLGNQRIDPLPPEKRNFGVVFQGYALFPHMNVRTNVGYPLSVRGVPRVEIEQHVTRTLELVQLSALADRLPRELSGGQQQRVALARALVFDPSIVLLDEPFSALDKKLRAELQVELKALHARLGTTFVFVTHDQEEAMAISDRIVILRDGRIVQAGEPAALYDRPINRFVAEFLGQANFFEGTLELNGSLQAAVRAKHARLSVCAPAPGRMEAGQRATVALRPERIQFANGVEPAPGWNRLAGTVSSITFAGLQRAYRVETDLGTVLVSTPSHALSTPRATGLRVTIEWPPEAAILLHD